MMLREERNSRIMAHIAEYTRVNTVSRAVARAALIREGIYTQEGELMPEFGGPALKTEGCKPQ